MSEQNSFVSDPLSMFYDLQFGQFIISQQTKSSLTWLQDLMDNHNHTRRRRRRKEKKENPVCTGSLTHYEFEQIEYLPNGGL